MATGLVTRNLATQPICSYAFANTGAGSCGSTGALRSSSQYAERPLTYLRSTSFCKRMVLRPKRQVAPFPSGRHCHSRTICAADWSRMKKCSDAGFGRRQRRYQARGDHSYAVLKNTIKISKWCKMPAVTAELQSKDQKRLPLTLAVIAFDSGAFRVLLSDTERPLHDRYIVTDVISSQVKALPIDGSMISTMEEYATISLPNQKHFLRIYNNPFRLEMITQDQQQTIVSMNSQSRLKLEDYASAPCDIGSEECFGGHVDPQHRGPESVGIDVSFPSAEHLYGIPERTSSFSLPDTVGDGGEVLSEPNRMYNLDVNFFELDEPLGLYGAVPLLYARARSSTVGMFWHNASETYVDVQSHSTKDHTMDTHWFSESGIVDVFFLPGPSPESVFRQYLNLTGSPTFPPLFSVGYHQCRYSYEDDADVRAVDAGFTARDLPYDVMWLDIDHTNEKRYFTWDREKFPNPVGLQKDLASNGRKTVTIVDPHIKRDGNYSLHAHATAEGLYVQQADGGDYEGDCWAGRSSYPDFLSPRIRAEWAKRFNSVDYPGMTDHLHVWNDMNEPAVFDGPEGTMPKDVLHDGVEHRHVHNLYGHSMARATYEGLLQNREDKRAFVLTRSFFGGTQKYAAVWTGDNTACWGHLRSTVRMLLSLQICGITQAGADIGGFFGDPDGELLTRWYQVGAFQPFFRGHSNKETKRREPWLYGEEVTGHVREAIKARYEFLSYWYTLFASVSGGVGIRNSGPPMRPIWWECGNQEEEEKMWMVGPALLVAPVMEQGVMRHVVDLPNGRWYDLYGGGREARGRVDMEVWLGRMVVFLRGGSVVPRMDTTKVGSSVDVGTGRYALWVGLDERGEAEGLAYFDDGESFGFRRDEFCTTRIRFAQDTLTVARVGGRYTGQGAVDKVVVCGFRGARPRQVRICGAKAEREAEFELDEEVGLLVVDGVAEGMAGEDWEMRIN